MSSTNDWIHELQERRKYFTSSCAIAETIDPLRLEDLLKARVALKKDWDFDEKYIWSLQTGELTDFQGHPVDINDDKSNPQPMEVLLDRRLKRKAASKSQPAPATHLVIKWAFLKQQADALANWLIEWSQDVNVKTNFSMVTVMTSSLGFFPPEVQRWCNCITIPASTDEERDEYLWNLASDLNKGAVATNQKVSVKVTPELIDAARGLTLYDMRNAANESFIRYKSLKVDVFSEYKVRAILAAYKIRVVVPTRGFESVQGFEYYKTYLTKRILNPLMHPEEYAKEGVVPPKGMLMFGPPGVGKTWIARALAKQSNQPVIELSARDLLKSLVGESEARVGQITDTIESLAPCHVFMDEAEQLLMNRGRLNEATDSGVTSRVVDGLLTWLGDENRKAFVVAATNFLTKIDPAFLRVGRLDKSTILLYPDFDSRLAIIKHYSENKHHSLTEEDFRALAHATEFWNSAELSTLPTEAAYVRLDEGGGNGITRAHFDQAMKRAFKVRPEARRLETIKMINDYTSYAPNYEPWLLDLAKNSFSTSEDKSLTDALMDAAKDDANKQ